MANERQWEGKFGIKEEMEEDQRAMIRTISIVQKELEAHNDLESKIRLNQVRERLKDIRSKLRIEMSRMEAESEAQPN